MIIIANRNWYNNHHRREHNPLLWDLIVNVKANSMLRVKPAGFMENPPEAVTYLMNKVKTLKCLQKTPAISHYPIRDKEGNIVSVADIAFPDKHYAIFCDGIEWNENKNVWIHQNRLRYQLPELGWKFSVFSIRQVMDDINACLTRIKRQYA
ncbi:MAG TPA: hypothetical protein GXX29_14540 [Firmicutes bacterium]|nr:hypothetical protein [Bacillota bacterium]